MKPIITILLPVYNTEKFIKESIDSALNQTFKNFELLIINDGSTDNTLAILESYTDTRIKIITIPNSGVAKALNAGLPHINGEYIARMDADDISYPTRLEDQYNFMINNPEYVAIGSDANFITEEGEYLSPHICSSHTDEEIRNSYQYQCPFVHSLVLMKTAVFRESGGYPIIKNLEDFGLWLYFVENGKVCNLPKIHGEVRLNLGSVTVTDRKFNKEFEQIKKTFALNKQLTENEKSKLDNYINYFSKKDKEIIYYQRIGKKFLWHNNNPQLARKYFGKAIETNKKKISSYIYYSMSYIPSFIYSISFKLYKKIR